jgi:hypothetical protein
MRLSRLVLLLALAGFVTPAASVTQWPEVGLPPGAQGFSLDGSMSAGGMRMQVHGFLSHQPAPAVIAWFRASLGQPLVENQLGTSTVFGRAQGSRYLTVQIEPAGSGSRGLIAQTGVPALASDREAEHALQARWLARLPPDMRLQTLIRGHDGGRHYQYLVLESPHAPGLSRHAISSLMQRDGYLLEREVQAMSPPSYTLYFRGAAREATAVILAHANGSSAIVLNTIVTASAASAVRGMR